MNLSPKVPILLQWLVTGLSIVGIQCTSDHTTPGVIAKREFEDPRHARGFQTFEAENYTLIKVKRPWAGASREFIYALHNKENLPPEGLHYDQAIPIPVSHLVMTSTTHIPALDLLECQQLLSGFTQTKFISSPSIRSLIDQGKITELGTVGNMDYERLMELNPEVVMTYQSGADHRELEKLQQTGIPVLLNADFLEESPLGKAEWIKVIGWLVGKADAADSIFTQIERSYQYHRNLVGEVQSPPTVFSGSLYTGTWFAPGGDSFVAQFVKDAGGAYTWSDQSLSGTLELSFEAVIERNSTTEKWIGAGGFTSLQQLIASDPRYENLQAVKNQEVYNYHGRIGATGGYEYLEMGTARPDIVLRDFIKILHPELLPDHQMYFFKKLDP